MIAWLKLSLLRKSGFLVSLARKSPLREVEQVARSGAWGRIEYHHLLSCGHTEVRKRRETGPIRCVKCYAPPAEFTNEGEVEVCRLRLAGSLGVSPEDVRLRLDATEGSLRLKGAFVMLSADSVRRLVQPNTSRRKSGTRSSR